MAETVTRTLQMVGVEHFAFGENKEKHGWGWRTVDGEQFVSFSRQGSADPPKVVAAWQAHPDPAAPMEFLIEPGADGRKDKVVGIVGVYEPQPFGGRADGGRGGGRGGGSHKDPAERASIEAQVALKAAVELVSAHAETPVSRAIELVAQATLRFAQVLRQAQDSATPGGSEAPLPSLEVAERSPAPVAGAKSPAAAGDEGGGEAASGPGFGEGPGFAASPSTCTHPTWRPAPRPGWRLCPTCGAAERGAA